ncbi:hypothetical protein XspCFBP7912_15180 [Xanthomonas sp. CFBP 7912]|nr:hypothetical protein XspCFBP7912_15180 [Xanthomonas sp. CFBP 7912]RJS03491.1 hypothetical protein XnspCFBP7698_09920 [Xanthomonas sp. CFBP 7698]
MLPTVPTRESWLRLRNNETQRQRVACGVGVVHDAAAMQHAGSLRMVERSAGRCMDRAHRQGLC